MDSTSILTDQVRVVLIQTEDKKPRYDIYNQFINECKANNLTENDFYKKVLKVAHKSIDWNYFEEEKKRKEENHRRSEELIKIEEQKIQDAPEFIESLLQYSFSDGVVESTELQIIFNKAVELSQDENALAKRYKTLFDKNKYKPYPNPKLNTDSLKDTLLSTNWYNEKHYIKLTSPPAPRKPFPWKIAVISLLIVGTLVFLFFINVKSKEAEVRSKEAEIKLKEAEIKLRNVEIKLGIEKAKQDSASFVREQELKKLKDINDAASYLRVNNLKKQRDFKEQELRKQKEAEAIAASSREQNMKKQKELEAQEAEKKAERERQIELAKRCNTCNGTGYIIEYEKCEKCNGTGKKLLGKCKLCDGRGTSKKEIKLTCKNCNGTGKNEK